MKNDLSVSLRQTHPDRSTFAPQRPESENFRIELLPRRNIVHPNHHAIYFLEHNTKVQGLALPKEA
jgi:hypothetical protein